VLLCVCFCTGHFVMVPLNLTCLHCLQHLFNLFYLSFSSNGRQNCAYNENVYQGYSSETVFEHLYNNKRLFDILIKYEYSYFNTSVLFRSSLQRHFHNQIVLYATSSVDKHLHFIQYANYNNSITITVLAFVVASRPTKTACKH